MAGALAWFASTAQATTIDFRWVQTGCDGGSCAAKVSGRWTFTEEAVERGYVYYYTRRDLFPDDAPDGVEKFSFTVGSFLDYGYNRPPVTWTNLDAADGAARYQGGRSAIYIVTFSEDRQSIVAITQPGTPDWVYGGWYSTTFEKYIHYAGIPSVSLEVWPDAIEYTSRTTLRYPYDPGPTIFTGQWRVITPIPAPGSLALVGAALVAAGVLSGGTKWRRAAA